MALYNFKCPVCQASIRKLLNLKGAEGFAGRGCSKEGCTGTWERDQVGPTTEKLEKIDNGLMPRAVERNADAERLFKERAKKTPT